MDAAEGAVAGAILDFPGAEEFAFTATEVGSHFPFYENPAPFWEAVTGFLADNAVGKESATVGT
jgi:hypothetical protein